MESASRGSPIFKASFSDTDNGVGVALQSLRPALRINSCTYLRWVNKSPEDKAETSMPKNNGVTQDPSEQNHNGADPVICQ